MKRKDYSFLRLRKMARCGLLAVASLITACSSEDVAPTVTDDHVRISLRTSVPVRDFTYNPDWFAYTDVPTLGIYDHYGEGNNLTLAIENKELKIGESTTDWTYSGEATKTYSYDMLYRGRNHHLFAYGPYSNDGTTSFDGNVFSWKNVPLVSLTDKVIANKIVSLSKGVAVLQMNHLYAKVDIKFKINEKYAKLRTIEITDVEIQGLPSMSADGGRATYSYNYAENAVRWDNLNLATSGNFTWKVKDDLSNQFILPYTETDSVTKNVTEKFENVLQTFYLAPGLFNIETFPTFKITVTYNVYDKDGQETRHQQTVSNDIVPNSYKGETDPFSNGGYVYTFNVVIAPKYLYVLSDNDTESAFNVSVDPEKN